MSETPTMPAVRAICAAFVERSEALNYKGKRRDNAALDYMCGAATAAQWAGKAQEPLAKHLATIVHLVAIRGYFELRRIATCKSDTASAA